MNGTILKKISQDIEIALKEIGKKYKVEIKENGGSYNNQNATLKLQIADIQGDGTVASSEVQEYKMYAKMYGLPEKIGAKFESGFKMFEIIGMSVRSRRYPVLAKSLQSGKIFKFTVDTVKRGLKDKNAEMAYNQAHNIY